MRKEKKYIVEVSVSDRDGCCSEQFVPSAGAIRAYIAKGMSDMDNVGIAVKEPSDIDKDARIVELEEHLHALLKFAITTCENEKVAKSFWQTVYRARECMNESAFPNLHFSEMPNWNERRV